ncbi:MAG TPA: penicillin-binding protein activator, partial [Candidatus Acidoferrum sp.]|nr:penicillin-binding protein activator [Candidatus Acidoferrum sp.]
MPLRLHPLGLLPALLILGACSSTIEPQNRNPQAPVVELPAKPVAPTAAQLLEQARTAPSTESASLMLQAATQLRDDGNLPGALATLDRIQATTLPATLKVQMQLLRADIALARNLPRETLSLLQDDNMPPMIALESGQQRQFYTLRANALAATGATLDSALELIKLDPLLTAQTQRGNHSSIWQKLVSLPPSKLQELTAGTEDMNLHGWYELALAASSTSSDLDKQLLALQEWRATWPTHPAAIQMPPQMELIETLARDRPRQIALLLPLGTGAGIIVRDAFMGAYYHLQDSGGQVPVVKLYDTTNTTDIRQLHQQARREGAQLVIGPLLKQQVAQLQGEADLGVPTLALNNVDGVPASPLLYQFALSPEDEARQLAGKAWADGHRRVAILSPARDTSDVSSRKRDSFRAAWERLGGKVLALDTYEDDYTDSISRMLLLDESDDRHQRLGQLLGRSVAAQVRRRQDVDCIYLLAQP